VPHPRPDVVPVPTPVGPARVRVYPAGSAPRATLVLGHGAGGGVDARDLAALAAALPSDGVQVVLVEQPWLVAGRPVAGSMNSVVSSPASVTSTASAFTPSISSEPRYCVFRSASFLCWAMTTG